LFENLLGLGYLGVFIFAFIANIVPFFGPSNLIVAGAIGSLFPSFNPLLTGVLVALGSSIAKAIHYEIAFFASSYVKSRRAPNKNEKPINNRRAMLAIFIAAASPVPDEPIVIPLGLARYNPFRFFISYFIGKAVITITGAFLGQRFGIALEGYVSQEATIVISIISTIIITILIIKKDIVIKKLRAFFILLNARLRGKTNAS
jgi:membrane protein YqaA with SNARE-associated domain